MPLRQLRHPRAAGAVGGELGPKVRHALPRAAHAARDPLQHVPVELAAFHEAAGLDHDALLVERVRVGRHAAGDPAADVGVVGAAGCVSGQLAVHVDGGDDRDVRQVGAAAVRVVEDERVAGLRVLGGDRLHGRGHGPEMHRDVLGLHRHLAGRVEQRGRGVAPLLDVRGMGRADEHHSHLLAGGAERADHHLEGHGVH